MTIEKLPWRYPLSGIAIAVVMLGAACRRDREVRYQTVPLVQGTRSFGMPLVGIAVDAEHHEVYAIVGGSANGVGNDFRILWKGKEGTTYCATISGEGATESVCEIGRTGGARELQHLSPGAPRLAAAPEQTGSDSPETVRSIIEALPAGSGFRDTE